MIKKIERIRRDALGNKLEELDPKWKKVEDTIHKTIKLEKKLTKIRVSDQLRHDMAYNLMLINPEDYVISPSTLIQEQDITREPFFNSYQQERMATHTSQKFTDKKILVTTTSEGLRIT